MHEPASASPYAYLALSTGQCLRALHAETDPAGRWRLAAQGDAEPGRMTAPREVNRDPITGVQIRIGVMGSASEPADPAVAALCRRLGRTIAERGACLLTGACPGLPHESVLGAKEIGGHVVGIHRSHARQGHRRRGDLRPTGAETGRR